MKNIDKIKCILIDFENNDKTLNEAANEILDLFSVSFNEADNICKVCHKPKRMQNGVLQLLCECSEVEVCEHKNTEKVGCYKDVWCLDCGEYMKSGM